MSELIDILDCWNLKFSNAVKFRNVIRLGDEYNFNSSELSDERSSIFTSFNSLLPLKSLINEISFFFFFYKI